MARTRARIDLDQPASAAEALWYDTSRWPSFVDGFGHLVRVEGDWPRAGGRVVWDSVRDGRGRVVEEVVAYEVRRAQTVAVEDPRIEGTQTVTFTPGDGGGSTLEVELRWKLKPGPLRGPLVDVLFVRRAFRDALQRTLARFRRELEAEAELAAPAR